jgi:hypothetical protein
MPASAASGVFPAVLGRRVRLEGAALLLLICWFWATLAFALFRAAEELPALLLTIDEVAADVLRFAAAGALRLAADALAELAASSAAASATELSSLSRLPRSTPPLTGVGVVLAT